MIKKVFILIVTLSLIASCTQQDKALENKKINISFCADPPTFDPRKTGSLIGSTLSFMLFSGLNRVLPDGKIGPSLAEHYEVSEDQITYTFTLRDAKWSDGHPISAYDFESSWKKMIDPAFPSLTTKLFYCIKNAEQASAGKLSVDKVGIQALDKKTLKVELEHPTNYFLSLTAFCAFFPAPSHIVETQSNWDANPSSDFVTSGPFKMIRWSPKKELLLEKNPNYWDADQVQIDQLHIHIVDDANTALQMFEEKELDFLGSPISPFPYHANEILSQRKEFRKTPIAGSCFLSFNTKSFPFHNLSMRKAFSYAIDRKNIVKSITFNNQKPATRIIPPPFESNEGKDLIPNNDTQQAKYYFEKGLQELNISKDQLNIALQIPSNAHSRKISEAIQKQIQTALDIHIPIQELPSSNHMDSIRSHKHQLAMAEWIFQYNDVMNIFARLRESTSPVNYSQWEHSEFNALLNLANQTPDKTKYNEILYRAEKLLIEDLPITPLYHLNYLTIQQEGFEGVVIGEVGDLHFDFSKRPAL